jgi:hypothetical protein
VFAIEVIVEVCCREDEIVVKAPYYVNGVLVFF